MVAGKPLDHTYKKESVELVKKGCCNLARHISNARKYGVPVVIAINKFASDTQAELDAVREVALEAGMQMSPSPSHLVASRLDSPTSRLWWPPQAGMLESLAV